MTIKIEMGKEYQTVDGRDVRILCVDSKDIEYPVVGLLNDTPLTWTAAGGYIDERENNKDLVEKPKPVVGHSIVYPSGIGFTKNTQKIHCLVEIENNPHALGFIKTTITGKNVDIEYVPRDRARL